MDPIERRKLVYAMICRLSRLDGSQTTPTEDVIDLAWGVQLLMEQVFSMDTLVTLIHESEVDDAPNK